MGKASRRKKETHRNYSQVETHKRIGNLFLPPLLQVPKLKPTSWHSERLPEMLWAVLLITHLDREFALELFRRVAVYIQNLEGSIRFHDVTLSGLAKLSEVQRDGFVRNLVNDKSIQVALAPLLLFPELPAYSTWQKYLAPILDDLAWEILAKGVLETLDHQSQAATDCRWLKVLVNVVAGHFKLPSEDIYRKFVEYC